MALFGRKKKKAVVDEEPAPPPSLPDPPAPDERGFRSVEDHLDYILSLVEELPPFGQHISDCLGLSLSENIVADIDVPQFDNSAMDGYAVRHEDIAEATEDNPVSLAVVGHIPAGQVAEDELSPGTAMKIMTGAPVPVGADTVVKIEDTDQGEEDVQVFVPPKRGANIRARGEDIADGTPVLSMGDVIGPRTVSLLATVGIDTVLVRPRPRVVVISTGSELVSPGLDLTKPGQIYDSNSYLVAALAQEAGAQVYRVGGVGDDPDELRQVITDQLVRADLIVTTGGVSMGDHDIVKEIAPSLGATDFAKISMQPGKPQGFGLIGEDDTPILMLPGNPVSAFVSFEVFVRPVIRKLMGVHPLVRPTVSATLTKSMKPDPVRRRYARGLVTTDEQGQRTVELVGGHGSHLVHEMQQANALVILPPGDTELAVGENVDVWVMGEEA
ncbi:molybdotransferase-like divisome protein Glp [Enemella sp. A6]|uniref:molybdotransferase-like divisome protein Glp n=1 Tax=Enemella sp. A6 TaxID=3440152 RepID=UPI003EB714BB